MEFYKSSGKTYFNICKILDKSNLSKEESEMIKLEFEKMSKSNQDSEIIINNLIDEFDKAKSFISPKITLH